MRTAIFSLLLMLGFLVACQRDQIEVYRVPKSVEQPLMPGMPTMRSRTNLPSWKAPAGWVAQPLSEMRVGSFLINGKNGQTADVSVVTLAGPAGGNLANINRWRQQIELPPLSEAELKKVANAILIGGRQMVYVNFVSTKPLIQNQYRKRIVATIYPYEGQSWFFKLAGEDRTVQMSEPDFMDFLKSLRFADGGQK